MNASFTSNFIIVEVFVDLISIINYKISVNVIYKKHIRDKVLKVKIFE